MTRLHELFAQEGQSPWLDNLRRDDLENGHLSALVARGVRGITSNPTIFQKSITSSTAYDRQIAECLSDGASAETAYWRLVSSDVKEACSLLSAVYEESSGQDGFVSLEVDPHLAHDTRGTIAAAIELASDINRTNLMIKIPATDAGLSAISEVIGSGISVNVTLIFGLQRYRQVLEAFVSGIRLCAQRRPNLLTTTRSVASFFVSRVDSAVDPLLPESDLQQHSGRTAVAQARLAYQMHEEFFSSTEWTTLAHLGAHRQRPLWASTSTKNPAYPDLLYVDELIGHGTVNTLPESTLIAFEDHGTVQQTISHQIHESSRLISDLERSGISLDDIAARLEHEGVISFQQSFDALLEVLKLRFE